METKINFWKDKINNIAQVAFIDQTKKPQTIERIQSIVMSQSLQRDFGKKLDPEIQEILVYAFEMINKIKEL